MLGQSKVIRRCVVHSVVDVFVVVSGEDVGCRSSEHDSVVEEQLVLHGESDVSLEVAESAEEIGAFPLVEGGHLGEVQDHFHVDEAGWVAGLVVKFLHDAIFEIIC